VTRGRISVGRFRDPSLALDLCRLRANGVVVLKR